MTTPEEAFKKWFSENHPYHDEYDDATGIAEDAWLEATRQAYESCARICETEFPIFPDGEPKWKPEDFAEAIRYRLKEYDNGN